MHCRGNARYLFETSLIRCRHDRTRGLPWLLLEMKVLLFADRKEGFQASSLIFVYATLLVIALL